ncbi:hypothetical protein C0J52_26274 [Blattella germanica]|nr:hypothetical protein C0J52_26274 [Blattella germanica]
MAAAASVQSMASELERILQEVQLNMRSDGDWDSESVKLRVENLRSKTRTLKKYVNNELSEGKLVTKDDSNDKIERVKFIITEPEVIQCSTEMDKAVLHNFYSSPTSISVHSDPQIVRDQLSGTESSLVDSLALKEVNYKQGTPTHGVVRFSLAIDTADYILSEDEDILELGDEDIHTLSTSGSEVDYAVVESSSNPLAVIEEEAAAATDEDQELIPIDDIPLKKQTIDWEPDEPSRRCSVTSIVTTESDSLSEQPVLGSEFISSNMAVKSGSVPLIAITPDDGSDSDVLMSKSFGAGIGAEALTDVEELDSDTGESKHSNILVASVDDGFTDLEFLETSDEDEDDEPSIRPKTPTPLDNIIDFQDTVEESSILKGDDQLNSLVSKVATKSRKEILKVDEKIQSRLTDIEDLDASCDEDILENESDDVDGARYIDEINPGKEMVNIKDNVLRTFAPSPAITPDLSEDEISYNTEVTSTRLRRRTKHLVPVKPASTPHSDIENDSDDQEHEKLVVKKRYRSKSPGKRHGFTGVLTDIEDLEFSGDESPSALLKNEGLPGRLWNAKESRTPEENRFNVALNIPDSNLELHTDVEDFEVGDEFTDNIDQDTDDAESVLVLPLKEIESYYGSVSVVHKTLKSDCNYASKKIDTDTEDDDPVNESNISQPQMTSQEHSTDEDDVAISDTDAKLDLEVKSGHRDMFEVKFIEIEGEARPLVVPPNDDLPFKLESTIRHGGDTEKPVESDLSFHVYEGYKNKNKNKNIKHVQNSGKQSKLLLKASYSDSYIHGGVTDIEDISTESGEETETVVRSLTPEISDLGGTTVKTSEVMKVKKRIKASLFVDDIDDPITETEDLLLDGASKGRRKKPKSKTRLMPTKDLKQSITDVEDLELSDAEHSINIVPNIVPVSLVTPSAQHIDIKTDIEDLDFTEGEDKEDIEKEMKHVKYQSTTPDFMRHMDYNIVSMKEGGGPFSAETRRDVIDRATLITPAIEVSSLSPDIYLPITTDTEDFGSADEEAFMTYSRAETATPLEVGLDIEDHSMSTVHVKHTRKFDVDAPEEALHVKGGGEIHEVFTDVEDLGLSEEESQQRRPEDLICVMDIEDQVCVCVDADNATQDAVCICMGKRQGELSMEWKPTIGSAASHTSSRNATQGTGCIELSSTSSCLPPSCIRADMPSMQVAVPDKQGCQLTEPARSIPVAYSHVVIGQDHEKSLVNIDARFNPLNVIRVSITQTSLGYKTLMNVMRLAFSSHSWSMFYVHNPVMLEIDDNVLQLTTCKQKKVKRSYPRVRTRAWSSNVLLDSKAFTCKHGLQFMPLSSRGRSGSVSKLISQFEKLSLKKEIPWSMLQSLNQQIISVDHSDPSSASDDARYSDKEMNTLQKMKEVSETRETHFKPVVRFVFLKDRSISPRCLDPSPVQNLPAFKTFSNTTDVKTGHQSSLQRGSSYSNTIPQWMLPLTLRNSGFSVQRSQSLNEKILIYEHLTQGKNVGLCRIPGSTRSAILQPKRHLAVKRSQSLPMNPEAGLQNKGNNDVQ